MNIRSATDSDIPSIVELLKLSLGESLIPKSEAYWRWKHVDNPFGKSPVLVAEEDGRLIGVRAFMRWDWRHQDKVYKTLRAVDTATHPDHQGKGIFKNLTLQLVDYCKQDGYDFIFNTPNEKSMPGYLKMGWEKLMRYPIQVLPVLPRSILYQDNSRELDDKSELNRSPETLKKCILSIPKDIVRTDYTTEYFQWRYKNVPGHNYFEKYSEKGGWYVFYRIKVSGRRKELRVSDCLFDENFNHKSIIRFLKSESKRHGMNLVTIGQTIKNFKLSAFSFKLKKGPQITFRSLNKNEFPHINQWSPSIGDLELF